MNKKCFLSIFKKEPIERLPIWFMRQAGRYLPEYMKIRDKEADFLTMCYTPKIATEITLQPIQRFDLDAAIIFSDILVIPHALGFMLEFKSGEGPILEKVDLSNYRSLRENISLDTFKNRLDHVYEAIRLTRKKLNPSIALIGFAGAPWTLACYMIQGKGGGGFEEAKKQALLFPDAFTQLIEDLTFFVSEHLKEQIKAGVDAVQLFDSWANSIVSKYSKFCLIESVESIANNIKKIFPSIPFIHFPRKVPELLYKFNTIASIDAISIDESITMLQAKKKLYLKVLQGNLSPSLLLYGGNELDKAVEKLVIDMKHYPYIFNLGHGINKETPPIHVQQVIEKVRSCA